MQTETLRTATWWQLGQEYPAGEMEEGWAKHLFNDFHDILPGSCTEPAEQDALGLYARAAETCRRLLFGAATAFNAGQTAPADACADRDRTFGIPYFPRRLPAPDRDRPRK